MSKVRLYIEPSRVSSRIIIKDKDIIHKIKDVLRHSRGEILYIFDGNGNEYSAKLEYIDKNHILLCNINKVRSEKIFFPKIILGFPIIKEEKINFILQKTTELGVSEFVPFVSSHSIQSFSTKKLIRWKKIIIEATRQSDRLWLPVLNNIINFNEVLNKHYELKLFACRVGNKLNTLFDKKYNEIFVIIGPEGDFSEKEYNLLVSRGFLPIKLSSNILRTETSAIFTVGMLSYFFMDNN